MVYWMQRAQRALDNPALEVAVQAANALGKPCVVFFAPVPFYPHANLRHYRFLNQGIPAIADGLKKRGIGFVLRRYPDHHLLKFCDQVRPALVVGDENPMREPEHWRVKVTEQLARSFLDRRCRRDRALKAADERAVWRLHGAPGHPATVAGIFAARGKYVGQSSSGNRRADLKSLEPDIDITEGWKLDRSVPPVNDIVGGTDQALKRLKNFIRNELANYPVDRNKPERDGTSRFPLICILDTLARIPSRWLSRKPTRPRRQKKLIWNS